MVNNESTRHGVIEDTSPFYNIEKAFNISIDEDDCLDLYDMDLDEASEKIKNLIISQNRDN